MANYEVDPSCLIHLLPPLTELDLYNGKCYVSLVGFMFQDVRLKGIKVPLHVNFEEINLRFYVRYKGADDTYKRGVVFVKEFVPRTALSFVANTFYGEHYETVRTRHKWFETKKRLVVNYRWYKQGWHKLQVVAQHKTVEIAAGSAEEFITEHYWGYTKLRQGHTSEYEVQHPRWDIYPVLEYDIKVDFHTLYGPAFAFLQTLQPESVLLAEGSAVVVRSGAAIRVRK